MDEDMKLVLRYVHAAADLVHALDQDLGISAQNPEIAVADVEAGKFVLSMKTLRAFVKFRNAFVDFSDTINTTRN